MNTSTRPDPGRCGKMQDHDRHVWKGRVREVWNTFADDPDDWLYGRRFLTRTIGPWYECSGHLTVEGGHW